jgi:hypothetical protein
MFVDAALIPSRFYSRLVPFRIWFRSSLHLYPIDLFDCLHTQYSYFSQRFLLEIMIDLQISTVIFIEFRFLVLVQYSAIRQSDDETFPTQFFFLVSHKFILEELNKYKTKQMVVLSHITNQSIKWIYLHLVYCTGPTSLTNFQIYFQQ